MVEFKHITGFPARRVYKIPNTSSENQNEAKTFMNMYNGFALVDTRGKIKYVLI